MEGPLGFAEDSQVVSNQDALAAIERRFHELIRARAPDSVRPDLVLPTLEGLTATESAPAWFPVPGMYGGFAYWLDESGNELVLRAASWSRVVSGSEEVHLVTSTSCVSTAGSTDAIRFERTESNRESQ